MSDTFDHEGDAWNSLEDSKYGDFDDDRCYSLVIKKHPRGWIRDWTCHQASDRAYMISGIMRLENVDYKIHSRWIPKSRCTYNKGNHSITIDGWLANEIRKSLKK